MSSKTQNKRRWAIDLTGRRGERGIEALPAPPGYLGSVMQVHVDATKQVDQGLVMKKAWDLALSPLKSVSNFVIVLCNSIILNFVLCKLIILNFDLK